MNQLFTITRNKLKLAPSIRHKHGKIYSVLAVGKMTNHHFTTKKNVVLLYKASKYYPEYIIAINWDATTQCWSAGNYYPQDEKAMAITDFNKLCESKNYKITKCDKWDFYYVPKKAKNQKGE